MLRVYVLYFYKKIIFVCEQAALFFNYFSLSTIPHPHRIHTRAHTHQIHLHTHIFVFHMKLSGVQGKYAAHPIFVKEPSLLMPHILFLSN